MSTLRWQLPTIADPPVIQGTHKPLMSDTRLFSPKKLSTDTSITLRGDQARYIGRVLRLKPGATFIMFDGSGGEFPATVAAISRNDIDINIGAEILRNVESPLSIHLLQGVSRGERMDFVVQKATELGVSRITPVLSEFSVVKLDAKRAEKRALHWLNIATSACEQSGRNVLPKIDAPQPLRNWFGDNLVGSSPRIMLRPGAAKPLCAMHNPGEKPAAAITLLVGPEGGFSELEYEHAGLAGFVAVSFGPRIMRTETAAIAGITVLQSLFGDLGNNSTEY